MTAIDREVERQMSVVSARADEIVPAGELRAKLRAAITEARPLRIKYGIDPTSPHVHIGHLVPCRLLRRFQDLGHTAVLIIGDYTAQIGDPSGRNAERPPLGEDEVRRNLARYAEQLFRVVDESKAEVHLQSSWFGSLSLADLLALAARFSVAQLLAHETFRARLDAAARLSLHELLYPVLQAYDSVQVAADVEIGGSDQRFNCLCGRDLQRAMGLAPQVVVTVPLLRGTDGRKMSKSFDNHIAVELPAGDVVGRTMSMPDEQLPELIRLATDWRDEARVRAIEALRSDAAHPRETKLAVAANVAEQLHGADAARLAVEEFERVIGRRERPTEIERRSVCSMAPVIVDLLVELGLARSKSDARRLVEQRGVRLDGVVVERIDSVVDLTPDRVCLVQMGKRRFVEVVRQR